MAAVWLESPLVEVVVRGTQRPERVVWMLTLCTALALFGDNTLYAVLPVDYGVAGITTLQVGWMLSVNRLVRLPLNMPSGWLSDRLGPKWPYVFGVAVGCVSTLGYGLWHGFWPLLVLRALWGVAWALLIVASYKMILDVSDERTRGRFSGAYGTLSYFGGALGAMLGGVLVDRLGFAVAMRILGLCTALGCLGALTLPAGRSRADPRPRQAQQSAMDRVRAAVRVVQRLDTRLALIIVLNLMHRMLFAGVFYATFGLYLRQLYGEAVHLGTWVIGVASLAGMLLFARNVITVLVGPSMGYLSDRLADRVSLLLLGVIVGAAGLACFALGASNWLLGVGVLLVAVGFGLVPSILVAWIGDLVAEQGRGQMVGAYQTAGDLGSGLGPLIAYPLIAWLGVRSVYALSAVLLIIVIPWILRVRSIQPTLDSKARMGRGASLIQGGIPDADPQD